MKSVKLNDLKLKGVTGQLVDGIIQNWLLGLRQTNPAILDIFADRDKMPYRDLLPWSGEFAGKYITGAYYIYQITRDDTLRECIENFIEEFISYQAEDGYLGCFQEKAHLTGGFSATPDQPGQTWDAWAHYHAMFGLYLWYTLNGNEKYMETIHKIAQLFDRTFFREGGKRLVDIGRTDTNLAPYHMFALLANETGDALYLRLAREIELDIEDERAGQYISHAEKKLEFYQCPKPRWESLHTIMGFAEMYRATGEKRYLNDALWIFDSIMRTDVHNTGAFSTDEKAIGDPYKLGAVETCCVVAYNALASQLYEYTGRHDIIDFLERAHYNTVLASYNPTGYWSTYTCYLETYKCANFHHITFQSRPGSPNLNCCSVNAPRGVGQLGDWIITEQDDVTYINLYESFCARGDGLSIDIDSNYPAPGRIKITLATDGPRKIALRIPKWSKNSTVTFGEMILRPQAGEYLMLPERQWSGEVLTLDLDFSAYVEAGHLNFEGKHSIYYGPVLFGCDTSLVDYNVKEAVPAIKWSALAAVEPTWREDGRLVVKLNDGMVLSDYRTLGNTGSYFITYLTVDLNG